MDISAYLASVQDNPQSAMLARNVMQPGIPSPSGENAPDAGIPQPSWSDQPQQDTEPVTGGFDQAQMGMDAPTPAPMQDMGAPQQQQGYAPPPPPQMDMSALDVGGSSAEDFTQYSSDEAYARGGMVSRAPRLPRLPKPPRKPKVAGESQNGGLFSPSTRKGGPGEDPSTNLPEDSISPIGMYDKAGNLHGISDIGITKAELGQGGPQRYANAGMWGGAGEAGDSSGGLAEGGSVDELPNDKGDDRYVDTPASEGTVDDRRRDFVTPQEYKGMSDAAQAFASNYPAPGDEMLAGSKRTLKGPMKFDEGGSPDDIEQTTPAIPPPVENTERGEEMSGEMDQEKPIGFRERMGAAIGMHGRGMQKAVADGFEEIYRQNGVNTGVPTPQGEQGARAMMQGKGATPPDQAEAAIEANEGNSGKAVEAVSNFFGGKSTDPSQYEKLSPVKQMGLDKAGPDASPGAQAAAGLIQHIRTVWNKAAALASAAAEQGNLPKAAEALETGLNKIPDGTQVKVTPNQGGVDVIIDGNKTPVSTQQLQHIASTPFDVIAHMGVPQTIANLQNVQQLQHMSGQPQPQPPTTQPAGAAPQPLSPPKQQVPTTAGPTANMQQVEAAKARMAQQDMRQGLNSDGTPRGTGGADNSNSDDELPTNASPTAGRAPRAPAAPKTPAAARPRPNMKYTDDEAARAGRGLDRSGNPIEYTLQKPLTNQEKQGLTDVERYGDVSPEAMNRQRGNDQQLLMGAVNDRNKRLGTTADPVGGAAGLHSTWERNAAASAKLEFEAIKDPKPGDQERITQKWRDFWYKKQQQGGLGGSPPQTQGNQPQTQVKDGVTWMKVNGGWQRAQ